MAQGSLGGRNKAVYVEGLGSGLLLSVNYDFRFRNTQDGLGMRIGVGGLSLAATATDNNGATSSAHLGVVTLPVLVNYLVGKGRFAFEMGQVLRLSTCRPRNTKPTTSSSKTAISVCWAP